MIAPANCTHYSAVALPTISDGPSGRESEQRVSELNAEALRIQVLLHSTTRACRGIDLMSPPSLLVALLDLLGGHKCSQNGQVWDGRTQPLSLLSETQFDRHSNNRLDLSGVGFGFCSRRPIFGTLG